MSVVADAVAAMLGGDAPGHWPRRTGNLLHFERTLAGWATHHGNLAWLQACLASGQSPNAVRGSVAPLMEALASCKTNLIRALLAAGATITSARPDVGDEWIRLLASTRDLPLIKLCVEVSGGVPLADPRPLVYAYVASALREVGALARPDPLVALLRDAQPFSPTSTWWRSINPGQRARVLSLLRCMERTHALPLELQYHIMKFAPPTVAFE